MTNMLDDGGLFDMRPKASNLLRERYTEPPFTVLDRKGKAWTSRDRKWKALGIRSEVGRDGGLTYNTVMNRYSNWYEVKNEAEASLGRPVSETELQEEPWLSRLSRVTSEGAQTSIFSPTLCELVYRWYSAPGHRVLDPFAGGSVRGVVAGAMDRHYTGVELRREQVEANVEQAHIAGDDHRPLWVPGDSAQVLPQMAADGYEADLIFSCPPYAFLEKYSDDPEDLSNMSYPDFLAAYRGIIAEACAMLRPNRFAAWMVGEVREKGGDGSCVGLVPDTVQAFRDAGLELYNDHIILTPIGTAAVRTPRQFDASRKAGRIHEYLMVFVKGDAKAATQAASTESLGDDLAAAGGAQ